MSYINNKSLVLICAAEHLHKTSSDQPRKTSEKFELIHCILKSYPTFLAEMYRSFDTADPIKN